MTDTCLPMAYSPAGARRQVLFRPHSMAVNRSGKGSVDFSAPVKSSTCRVWPAATSTRAEPSLSQSPTHKACAPGMVADQTRFDFSNGLLFVSGGGLASARWEPH
jgi:hypothetical protein